MDFDSFVAEHARTSSKPHKGMTIDDTMSFFHHLSTLINAGTPLLQAIQIGSTQNQSLKLRKVLDEIAFKVASGSALYVAAASRPDIFQHHWVEVIRTGEVTGKMGEVLLELNKQIKDSRETRRKVVGALMYPMILIVVAVIAVGVMLWMVVPTFANMFKDMGAELPQITQYVVDGSNFIVTNGPYLAVAAIAGVVGPKLFARTESGRRTLIGCGLVLPMVGDLIVQSAMYRFASNLALMLRSGVPMLETIQTLILVYHTNPPYRRALLQVQATVSAGRPLATALADTHLFTTMMISMVKIGEESGELASVMGQIAPYYKEKMESMVMKVTKLLEPIIIMGMGTSIAGIMLAIYMPMFEMAGKVH